MMGAGENALQMSDFIPFQGKHESTSPLIHAYHIPIQGDFL